MKIVIIAIVVLALTGHALVKALSFRLVGASFWWTFLTALKLDAQHAFAFAKKVLKRG